MVEGRDGGGGVHIDRYIHIGIPLGLGRGRKVYFRESEKYSYWNTSKSGSPCTLSSCPRNNEIFKTGVNHISDY